MKDNFMKYRAFGKEERRDCSMSQKPQYTYLLAKNIKCT